MPQMKLLDGIPTVRVGRPEEDRHGLRTYPMLVTRPDGSWLAIGHARKHRRWPLPEVDFRPVVSVEIRVAVERTVALLVAEADRLVDAERQDAETLQALDAEAEQLCRQEAQIRERRAVLQQKREAMQKIVQKRWDAS